MLHDSSTPHSNRPNLGLLVAAAHAQVIVTGRAAHGELADPQGRIALVAQTKLPKLGLDHAVALLAEYSFQVLPPLHG